MRIAWAGTARFAELVLARVLDSPHEVVVCLTTPDRPSGRHGSPQPSVLKTAALELGLPVVQPADLRAPGALVDLLAYEPDVLVACAYGRIVPADCSTRCLRWSSILRSCRTGAAPRRWCAPSWPARPGSAWPRSR